MKSGPAPVSADQRLAKLFFGQLQRGPVTGKPPRTVSIYDFMDEDSHRGQRTYGNWLGDKYFHGGPNQTMGRIDRAPFCSVDVVPGNVGTFGGVVTDAQSRVLREDGIAIDGLCAAGVAAASMMGRVHPGAGASIGLAMAFGWIAARHAAGVNDGSVDLQSTGGRA